MNVRPSPETNDHEVRFIADGEDIIDRFWPGSMGLDPDDIFSAPYKLRCTAEPHRSRVARCDCGVVGCGDVEVIMRRVGDRIEWVPTCESDRKPKVIQFLAESYDAEIERALHDISWETPDRTAARLLAAKLDHENLARHGLTYQWASGRLRAETFGVSLGFEPGPYQILIYLPWNGVNSEEIANFIATMLTAPPASWDDVVWLGQGGNHAPPSIAGPSWKPFRS